MILNMIVFKIFPFKGYLAEKQVYKKHRGKIMKYNAFLTGLYWNFINPLLCWVFADRVTYCNANSVGQVITFLCGLVVARKLYLEETLKLRFKLFRQVTAYLIELFIYVHIQPGK